MNTILKKGGEIVSVDAENLTSRTKVMETIKETLGCKVNLQEADIIIAGGRGLGDAKGGSISSLNLQKYSEALLVRQGQRWTRAGFNTGIR